MERDAAHWALLLESLTRAAPRPAEADDRPRGRLRVHLVEPGQDEDGLCGFLRIELLRFSRRGDKPLAPRPAPRTLETLEKQARDLSLGDRAFARLAEQRWLLGHVINYRYADSVRFADAVERLDAELFAALPQVSEVCFEGRPVRFDPEPRAPVLEIADAPGGGLRLAWCSQSVRACFPVGPGQVLDASDVLRPLPADLAPGARARVGHRLPDVGAADVESFLEGFVARSAFPIRVTARRLPLLTTAPAPRLFLRDEDGALHVELRFGYGGVEVLPGDPSAFVQVPDALGTPRLTRRDRDAEMQAITRLYAALPGPPPLRGDDVHDFLLEGLPVLSDFAIYADASLTARRPRGTLAPTTRLTAGVDWFDLEVELGLDGVIVPAAAALESWRRGDRYHLLADGTRAKLPQTWLSRHGEALSELVELRRRGRLSLAAAPLAAALVAEAPPSEARDRWQSLAGRLAGFEGIPDRPLPEGLRATLRSYQIAGYRWLCCLRDLGLGCVLADDMGLGKTLQALALLLDSHREPGGSPSLVVAPTSVVHNWMQEAARFAPDLKAHLFHGAGRREPPADADVVVTSYALLRTDDRLAARRWRHVLLDEAQAIKNPDSQVAQAARDLHAEHRLALTGTPLENHLLELWSLFQFALPGFFAGRRAFTDRYAAPVQRRQDADALGRLRQRIRPFLLRRLKREVAAELPPRQEQVLWCELGPAQRHLYERVKATHRATALGDRATPFQVLEALMRLRQACCDPRLLPFEEADGLAGSAKLDVLLDLLTEAIDEGHRTLVFSQWPSLLKLVAEALDERAVEHLYLDGSTRDRRDLQARWNDEAGPAVFLVSLKAGGTGLNLTGADTVVHLDPWWNPAAEAQATDRAHRIGQTRPVMVYKLVARDTVEEKILDLQARKRALFEGAIDAERLVAEGLTRADLEAVFL